jgi:putative transposase
LNGYTQAFNKQQNRKGTLFRSRFGRSKVGNRQYFCDLTCYIHHNPIHHFGLDGYYDWGFSSYNMFTLPQLYDETYGLNYDTSMSVFDGIQGFMKYHYQYRLNKGYLDIENMVQQSLK